jgi:hypothetical protein
MKGTKLMARVGKRVTDSGSVRMREGDGTLKIRVRTLAVAFLLSVAAIGGCGPTKVEPTVAAPTKPPTPVATVAPTEEPTAIPTEAPPQVPDPGAARDAALVYVAQNYGVETAKAGAAWMEEDLTKEGLVGASTLQYTAEDWRVTVSFPIVAPSATSYTVTAVNEAIGFDWVGEVDAAGQVTELAVVEAPDTVFEGVSFSYDDSIATNVGPAVVPAADMGDDAPDWAGNPEHLEFSFEGYSPSETFHRPRIYVYNAMELESASHMGAMIVSAARGMLDTRPRAVVPNSILPAFNAGQLLSTPATDLDFRGGRGVRYLTQMGQAYFPANNRDLFYAFQGLTEDGQWYVAAILPVSHPSLPADGSEIPGDDFEAFAENFETYAAEVAAQLDAEAPGSFTPDLSLLDAMMASVRVDTAATETANSVVAWGGFVEGQPEGAQFDDCLVLQPEEAGKIGLSGADNMVEAQIQALRESGAYAHFWGTMTCPAVDCGGCQLIVERLREDAPGPFLEGDAVDGWKGTIVGMPEGAQYDDYFALAGKFPVGFGIEGIDASVVTALMNVQDTGRRIRVWGQVDAGLPDAFGSRILATRVEIVEESAEEAGWLTYSNEPYGYSLMYPPDATLLEGTTGRSIQISGPLIDNERWPMIEVTYFDSEFYHPPEGADLGLWIVDHGPDHDGRVMALEVAGLLGIRVTAKASPQAYGFDEYYVVKDGQLFRIALIHTKDQPDWKVYGMFLDSFTFE